MVESKSDNLAAKAKHYCTIKYSLSIFQTLYILIILLVFSFSRVPVLLERLLCGVISNFYLCLAVYFLVLFAGYYVVSFSFVYYKTFILEHQFGLSRQEIGDWFQDQVKGGILFYIITLIALEIFYYLMRNAPGAWWWMVSLVWIFLSIIMAKLVPVLIVPLFFKYKKLADEALRQRILSLASRTGVAVCDVFEIDMSKKSLKANAAFTGLGKTRRVILADTLKDNYMHDEIEVILAHELAHYKLGHIIWLLCINACGILLSFYILFSLRASLTALFRLPSFDTGASLPVLFLFWMIWEMLTRPLENAVSRSFERDADKRALAVTGLKDAFISMMEKLSIQNLADRNPHPLIKFFFFDHPSVDERIASAKKS